MTDDPTFFRKRADAERATATTAGLANVRDRALRAAERWGQLADRNERGQVQAKAHATGIVE